MALLVPQSHNTTPDGQVSSVVSAAVFEPLLLYTRSLGNKDHPAQHILLMDAGGGVETALEE